VIVPGTSETETTSPPCTAQVNCNKRKSQQERRRQGKGWIWPAGVLEGSTVRASLLLPTCTPEWYQPRSALQAACIGFLGCKHVRMADPDVRWLQRALEIASAGALSELEELGLIQTFKSTHELMGERHQRIQGCGA